MSKKNKVSYKTLKIKQLCHLKMSENNDPVTWNCISGQRPQLHLCKSQKKLANIKTWQWCKICEATHNNFIYMLTLNYGNIWTSASSFLCSVTVNMQFQIKWLSSKTKKWKKLLAVKDLYYYRLPDHWQDSTLKELVSNTVTNCLHFWMSRQPGIENPYCTNKLLLEIK